MPKYVVRTGSHGVECETAEEVRALIGALTEPILPTREDRVLTLLSLLIDAPDGMSGTDLVRRMGFVKRRALRWDPWRDRTTH